MTSESVLKQLAEVGVVPVIAIESADAALGLADALIAGGLPVAEITFRTDAAAEVIRAISRERPDLLIGAGTVLTVKNLERAHDAGARFIVAPGFNPAVVKRAIELELPVTPGVMTPATSRASWRAGARPSSSFPPAPPAGWPCSTRSRRPTNTPA